MLILGLPIACWGLLAVVIFVCAAVVSNRLSILQFGACMITIWLLGLGVIVWDPCNDFPDEIPGANATQMLNPGYGWSCLPVNNSTGEIVCRPVTLEVGGS